MCWWSASSHHCYRRLLLCASLVLLYPALRCSVLFCSATTWLFPSPVQRPRCSCCSSLPPPTSSHASNLVSRMAAGGFTAAGWAFERCCCRPGRAPGRPRILALPRRLRCPALSQYLERVSLILSHLCAPPRAATSPRAMRAVPYPVPLTPSRPNLPYTESAMLLLRLDPCAGRCHSRLLINVLSAS